MTFIVERNLPHKCRPGSREVVVAAGIILRSGAWVHEGASQAGPSHIPELPVPQLPRLTNAELGAHAPSEGVGKFVGCAPVRGQLLEGGQFRESHNLSHLPSDFPWLRQPV